MCDVHRFPLFFVLLGAICTCGTYVWAVLEGHVSPYLPYISETGANYPEAGFFSLTLTCVAFSCFCVIFIRYRLVFSLTKYSQKSILYFNTLGLLAGAVSSLGMLLVAAYPMSTIRLAHTIGAVTCLWGGLFYMTLQTITSYIMHPEFNGLAICRIRLLFTFMGLLFMVLLHVMGAMGRQRWKLKRSDLLNRTPSDEGFHALLTSAVGEWGVVFTILAFILSYVPEFKKIKIKTIYIPLVSHLSQDVVLEPGERSRLILM